MVHSMAVINTENNVGQISVSGSFSVTPHLFVDWPSIHKQWISDAQLILRCVLCPSIMTLRSRSLKGRQDIRHVVIVSVLVSVLAAADTHSLLGNSLRKMNPLSRWRFLISTWFPCSYNTTVCKIVKKKHNITFFPLR